MEWEEHVAWHSDCSLFGALCSGFESTLQETYFLSMQSAGVDDHREAAFPF